MGTQFTGYATKKVVEAFRLIARQSGKPMTQCYDEALTQWIEQNKGKNITLIVEPQATEDLVALASIVAEMLKNREE